MSAKAMENGMAKWGGIWVGKWQKKKTHNYTQNKNKLDWNRNRNRCRVAGKATLRMCINIRLLYA